MVTLTGLQVSEYSHPDENKAMQALNKTKWLKDLLNWVSDKNNIYNLKVSILGSCIEVTESDMPELYSLVSEVCRTLDYAPVPRIYMYHDSVFDIDIFPGVKPVLKVPDFIVNEFDREMLRFQFGKAVSALKADTCQMRMLAKSIRLTMGLIPGLGTAAAVLLADWSRKAGLTEDRGGLLACQDLRTAERALMRMAGMPLRYLDSDRISEYIKACQDSNQVSSLVQSAMTLQRTEVWNNDRILELYKWHYSGQYDDIIEEYE